VELFFVISGFVILGSVERSSGMVEFAKQRFARLYPMYIVGLIVSLPIIYIVPGRSWLGALASITMLQRYLGFQEVNLPAWTLAYELAFYFLIGLLAATGQLMRIMSWSLTWLSAMLIFRLKGIDAHLVMPMFGQFFISGMALYKIAKGDKSRMPVWVLTLSIAYSAFGRTDWAPIQPLIYVFAHVSFVAAVHFAVKSETTVFSWRPIVWIGTISYSVYLLNASVGIILNSAMVSIGLPPWSFIVPALAVTFGVSAITKPLIEDKGRRWLLRSLIDYGQTISGSSRRKSPTLG
jgi:peptidoglycan/LPS O-acetylase OafA/YrhL